MSDSFLAVGLDVGGTKIAGGIVELPSGGILSREVIMTLPQRGGEAVLSDALALARRLVQEAAGTGSSARGIGVGVAELIDGDGNVTSGQTIAWRGVPVRQRFCEIAPATVESDVRAAALAESIWGGGKPFQLFAYITVGTGISFALVQDGRVYSGARGNAILLSSGPLSTTCTECGAELHQVLEQFASGPALVARYNQRSSRKAARAEEVTEAAARNDPAAIQVVQSAGEALGNSVGFLINILDPEAVIVGGGLGLTGGLYWSSFVASTRKHIWSDATRDLPILPALLGTDAGLIGAAATVWRAGGSCVQPQPAGRPSNSRTADVGVRT
jgi:glucokinase